MATIQKTGEANTLIEVLAADAGRTFIDIENASGTWVRLHVAADADVYRELPATSPDNHLLITTAAAKLAVHARCVLAPLLLNVLHD